MGRVRLVSDNDTVTVRSPKASGDRVDIVSGGVDLVRDSCMQGPLG